MVGRKLLIARRNQGQKHFKDNEKKKDNNSKKGARWSKGHSCVSNPSTTKYREQASSMFLHPVAGNSLLTVKNLNANRGNHSEEDSDNDTVLSSDVASLTISDSPLSIKSSASSVRSLASGWSQISHNAFEKFLRKFKGDFSVHKDMLSIIGAASEVINDAGGKKNETEFFATFMSLLGSCPSEQYQPVMSLVCIIIGKVSPGVLQLRFGDIYPKIGEILSHAVDDNDELLIRTSIEAFTKLIRVQETIVFEEDKALESIFYMILKCALHEKPRVRRKVRLSIKFMMTSHNEKQASLIPKIVLGWILDQLACYPTCNAKVVADSLTLLTTCWSSIQRISFAGSKKLYEGVLRVMSSGDGSILKIGFSFFTVVFQNNSAVLDSDPTDLLVTKLVVALWDLQPDWRNTDAFLLWMTCVLVGMVRSNQNGSEVYANYLPSLFEKIAPIWLTNYGKKVLKLLKEYLPHIISENTEAIVLDPCFQTLAKSYLIVPPNVNVLQATECVLESLTPKNFTDSAKEVFLQLAQLRESPGVTATLGKFVKTFGINELWMALEVPTRWNVVLPLIHENLNDANISFWKKEILTYIGRLGKPDIIWQSFIGFCRSPKDPENFPAELVGKVIREKPELRLSALAALRLFVEWSQCKVTAIKYSKNYLPLLFNLYIEEKSDKSNHGGHADAIGVTIQKYLGVCEQPYLDELLVVALKKFQSATEGESSPIYDLIAFISFNVSDAALQTKVLDAMTESFKNPLERKRIYRVITSLAKNDEVTGENLTRIYKMLCESKGETKSNAAAIRLECINVVTEKNEAWLRDFLLEVILNLISVNAKAKRCATKFVLHYCSYLTATGKSIEELEDVILTGLKSTSSLLISSTAFFTFLTYKELKPSSPNSEILNVCISQLQKNDDPIVLKYCLAYINLCLSIFQGGMGPFAGSIGTIISQSKYPRKEVNKILARMIRVFGSAGLKAVLPNSDEPKMHVRIKNLCKKLKKLKEEKAKGKTPKEEKDDSDDENEDEFGFEKADTKTLVVIKEGLVNFLDPKEITSALVSDRKPSKPEDDFKLSEDGKMIIGNCGDSDVEVDDDDLIDEEDIANAPLQRKRKSSESVASSKRSTRTSKTSFSTKSTASKKRKSGAAGNRSAGLQSDKHKGKKFKSASSVSSRSSIKFRK